nr:MAG TPA: hypothetical protein [Caudoviricetes sp.]
MFKVGDRVVFVNAEKHKSMSWCYPKIDSIGIVKEIGHNNMLVDWGDAEGVDFNSGSKTTKSWWCYEEDVKPYHEPEDDEVWEMLKPKMERIVTILADVDNFHDEVKKMVVDAYRSGYGRAMKGRPFRIKPKNTVKN